MNRVDFSNLILRLTASAIDSLPQDHQARMVGWLHEVTDFDAAWWGWSSFKAGKTRLVNSASHNLPASFEAAVCAMAPIDPFIRHGRNLSVFALSLDIERSAVAPDYRDFARTYGLAHILNGHCRLDGASSYNFYMSLYRNDEAAPFSQEDADAFRLILRHLEQSLSLSLRAEIRGRAPPGGEAALLDIEGQIVGATRGFAAALAAAALTPRRQASLLRGLAQDQGHWFGTGVTLTAEPYHPGLIILRLSRPGLWDRLAPRERQVAEMFVAGRTGQEIALILRLSKNTVRNQIATVYRKTETKGKLALARALSRI